MDPTYHGLWNPSCLNEESLFFYPLVWTQRKLLPGRQGLGTGGSPASYGKLSLTAPRPRTPKTQGAAGVRYLLKERGLNSCQDYGSYSIILEMYIYTIRLYSHICIYI